MFQERRQFSLIVVIGEHSRCDLLEDIAIDDIEESEPCAPPSAEPHYARLITFWKPHKRYQVRASAAYLARRAHAAVLGC